MTDDWIRSARKRMLDAPRPGCWIGLIVRAIEPVVNERGERTPAHFLVGGWAPGDGGLYPRLPEFAAIASPDADRALRELFVHLDADASVLLVGEEHADAALLAEMVLVCDSNLEAYQREALQRFAADRRARLAALIRRRYTDRESGFETFRSRLLGDTPAGGTDPAP